jgi:hypothetical protein
MYISEMQVQVQVTEHYRKLLFRAQLDRTLGRFWGHQNTLRSLAQALDGYCICGQRSEGYKSVNLECIVGSEGRSEDFDVQYRPLKQHTEQRWYSVARAQLTGVNLPPVVLIRVGDEYYVRDGNHRVSVARAFGQAAIEAEVTAYTLVRHTASKAQGPVVGRVAVAAA